jgi:hypothetical protein
MAAEAAAMSAEAWSLIALRCPTCGAGLEPESEDVVFYCGACKKGYRAADTEPVLESVEVTFLVAPTVAVAEYRPFWRLDATVDILERQVGSGISGVTGDGPGLGGFIQRVLPGARGGSGASQALRFMIPAYRTPLKNARALALGYGAFAQEPEQKLGEHITGASLAAEDARKFAEFLFLLREVQAVDLLLSLRYTLEFTEPPVLVGVPFTRRGVGSYGSLVDARLGLPE